jgi:serine/threonine protein phosphatase PrpC
MNACMDPQNALVEWGVAASPMVGQTVCGDLHLVKPFEHGALLAVVDGVGHGDEAVSAAQIAIGLLEKNAGDSTIALVKSCHLALASTRGAVMTLASLNEIENTLTWLGVGNVDGRLLRAGAAGSHSSEGVLLRSGVVGYQLPELHFGVVKIRPGDLLIFATDGVRAAFDEGINLAESPQKTANRILARHFKGTDDALVLVVRYLGRHHE